MGRSLKKGPFIADSLLKKVEKQNTDNDKSVSKLGRDPLTFYL